MTTLKKYFLKIKWLTQTKEFHQHPLRILIRVIKYELIKFSGKSRNFVYDKTLIIKLYPNDGATRLVYYFDYHEPLEFRFLMSFLQPNMVCVDIGANIGLYSLFLAKRVHKVIAFEPYKQTYFRLRENIHINRISNISIIDKAVSNNSGEMFINIDESDSAKNFVSEKRNSEKKGNLVNTISLDDHFHRSRLSRIDYIKIDAEGTEPAILMGAEELIGNYRPIIQFEISNKFEYRSGYKNFKYENYFKEKDYELYKIESKTNCLIRGKAWNTFAVPNEKKTSLIEKGLLSV